MIQMIVYDIMLSSVWSDVVGNGLRRNRRVSRRTLLSSDSNIGTSHRSPLYRPEKGSGKLFPGALTSKTDSALRYLKVVRA